MRSAVSPPSGPPGNLPPVTNPITRKGESPQTVRRRILVVEDNKADVFLIQQGLASAKIAVDVTVLSNGEEAMRWIDQVDQDSSLLCPSLIMLDLNLPRRTGAEVLRHIRSSRRCGNSPVLIVTSSDSQQDREQAAALGANQYFRKPSDYDAYLRLGELVRSMLEETAR